MKTKYINNVHKVYASMYNLNKYKNQSNTLYNLIHKNQEVIHNK